MKGNFKNKTLKRKKVRLTILTIAVGMMLVGSTNVQAATTAVLQANLTTHDAKNTNTGAGWLSAIRQMEAGSGTMGLNAIIDGQLVDSSNNGIDVHMMKTTEWGAVEILAASGYGAGKAESVGNTTTNNSTGVYIGDNTGEWNAGVAQDLSCDPRYYDKYTVGQASGTSAAGGPKAGDGIGSPTLSGAGCYPGCAGWPSTNDRFWINYTAHGFLRGNSGLFTGTSNETYGNRTIWTEGTYPSRGVAVVGEGL